MPFFAETRPENAAPLCCLILLAVFLFNPPALIAQEAVSALDALVQQEAEAREGLRWEENGYPVVSMELEGARARSAAAFLERARDLDPGALPRDEQLRLDSFIRSLEGRVRGYENRNYLTPLNHETGPHASFMRLGSRGSFPTVEEYDRYLNRLQTAGEYLEQYIVLMREGLATGLTRPREVLGGHEGMINGYLADSPESSALAVPLHTIPTSIPQGQRERIRSQGVAAIRTSVYPALERFRDFLVEEYIPGARMTYSVAEFPGGQDYYEFLVRSHTTLEMSAQEVHDIGLAEVARIRSDMEEIIQEVGFQGDFQDFLDFLRTDPQFYVDTPEALLMEASTLSKRIDGLLPAYFHLESLPRRPYGVEPVPADLAPNYTGGRYSLGFGDRAGFYWVNTYDLPSRPLYVLPALTLHEAVPGHHLQIALAQEMHDGRGDGITAYSEGWALYAEFLGKEMGIYDGDPYGDFGRLTYEMWRACRLVVDTGIHALGWSRDEVREYLAANTALSLHEVGTETDRYIAVPGQALSYKIGELTIRRLRLEAEAELGDAFDLKDFHHEVLKSGPVPLSALEENIRAWIGSGGGMVP
ncbi:MAG: DUF885 domain-containing protein [Gemmatimonadota bacterium]